MPFITQGKTNWKFLLIVIVLALIVGGGALWYAKRPEKPYQPVEIKKSEVTKNETNKCLEKKLYIHFISSNLSLLDTQEMTDESLKEIIIQSYMKEATNNSCPEKTICSEQDLELEGKKIDLNNDNVPEYIIFLQGTVGCPLRSPAHESGPNIVFGFIDNKWTIIGDMVGGKIILPMKTRTNGYLNLAINTYMSASSGSIDEYQWDGKEYKLIKTTDWGPEDESIPKGYEEFFPG